MARLNRPAGENPNPSTMFLEWKSNDKCFEYYDKLEAKKVKVKLPLKFLFLEHYHTVKGWNDASESGIYSNEVYSIGKEPVNVKSFKGGDIAEGIYKDIRTKVKDAGGVYHRSVYVMLEDGYIANLQLKGSVVGGLKKETSVSKEEVLGYSDFYKSNHHLLDNQWIEIKKVADGKKGSIKFSIPVFEVGDAISPEANTLANDAAATLQSFIDTRAGLNAPVVEDTTTDVVPPNTVEDDVEDDDLDF